MIHDIIKRLEDPAELYKTYLSPLLSKHLGPSLTHEFDPSMSTKHVIIQDGSALVGIINVEDIDYTTEGNTLLSIDRILKIQQRCVELPVEGLGSISIAYYETDAI